MTDDPDVDRLYRSRALILVSLAGLVAVLVLGILGRALLGPSPARDVVFEGGWEDVGGRPSCHGPDLWTGEVAYSACDRIYRDRALVRLEPERARAVRVHRWENQDGNTPRLAVARPCGAGRLLVVAETDQTRLLLLEDGRVTERIAEAHGRDVLGAACREGAVELFVRGAVGAADGVLLVPIDAGEPARTIASPDVQGRIVGAWREADGWHAVVRVGSEDLRAGPLGGDLARLPVPRGRPCLVGEPGGWLEPCGGADFLLTQRDGALRARPSSHDREAAFGATVLHAGGDATEVVLARRGADGSTFAGLGDLDFELFEDGDTLFARRESGSAVPVARARYSSIQIGARALPLSGGRVAVWGGLGNELIVLGPDLERQDGLGALERLVRPVGRFRASASSTYAQVSYVGVLLATVVWLVTAVVWIARRRKLGWRPARWPALVYLLLAVVGGYGYWEVAGWI